MSQSNEFVKYFLSHRNVTVELINKIEPEHYDFKPTPTSMSAQELTTHMLYTFYRFTKAAKEGDPSLLREKVDETETNLSNLAKKYTEETIAMLESMTDEDYNRELEAFGAKLPARQLLHMGLDHEIHHKGNLFVYVRAMGHTDLPFYVHKG